MRESDGVGQDEFSSDPERRWDARRPVCLPVDVEHPGDPSQMALVRDLSPKGAFLLTRLEVRQGEQLDLRIHFPAPAGARTAAVRAVVVRIEALPAARGDLWTSGVAVKFEPPLEGYDVEMEQFARMARDSGLSG